MRMLTIISFCLTVVISCLLLVVPIYSDIRMSTSWATVTTLATLLEVNGRTALIPLAIPVLTALMPIIFPNRWVCTATTVVLALFVFVAGFSIGLFYLPSAAMLFAATILKYRSMREI